MNGPGADWGTLKCGCHPDCGVGTAFMVSKRTKEWAPVPAFIDVDRFMRDARAISDAARGPLLTRFQTAVSLLRNYSPSRAPRGFTLFDLVKKFDKDDNGLLDERGGRLVGRPTASPTSG